MMDVQLAMKAFQDGFLEKLAELQWTSHESALRHSRKHAGRMHLTPEQYLQASREMFEQREAMKPVPDKKLKGALVYWDRKTGRKLVTTPQGQIVSFYHAGTRP